MTVLTLSCILMDYYSSIFPQLTVSGLIKSKAMQIVGNNLFDASVDIFSRPGQSQGLFHKHLCSLLINY